MKLHELETHLRAHPEALPRFVLPHGEQIPPHFHITEVGHVTKRFIDCGGTQHDKQDTCVLQTWASEDGDHRLDAPTFAKILERFVRRNRAYKIGNRRIKNAAPDMHLQFFGGVIERLIRLILDGKLETSVP